MNKVVSLFLISEQKDKNGQEVNYKEINKILWGLQSQTREIKNKTVQYCWEWLGFSSEYNKQNGVYPKEKDILNYTLSGYINDKFKTGYDLFSSNISQTSRAVCGVFNKAKKEILKGDISIFNYKSDQPLDIHNKAIKIAYINKEPFISLNLLNRQAKDKYNFKDTTIRFKAMIKDNSSRIILERCYDGIYKVSGSQLVYNKKKKLWNLKLCYSFENKAELNLDKNRILGVDVGVVYPICASVNGELNRFAIQGGEIEEFRKRTEARKKSLLKQAAVCGDGRIGHGRTKRTEAAYKIQDKVARFRDTANHKYSRALIDYAIKNGCGTIQMEKLTGITANADKFLKNWSYYDLQMKIENKAKEVGIDVIYIDPKFTSQRCSKCGYIHTDNRPEQSKFKCLSCGFEANADYNASQNISIRDIDKIIQKSLSANIKIA